MACHGSPATRFNHRPYAGTSANLHLTRATSPTNHGASLERPQGPGAIPPGDLRGERPGLRSVPSGDVLRALPPLGYDWLPIRAAEPVGDR